MASSFLDAYKDALIKVEIDLAQEGSERDPSNSERPDVAASGNLLTDRYSVLTSRLKNTSEETVFLAGIKTVEVQYRRGQSRKPSNGRQKLKGPVNRSESGGLNSKSLLPGPPRPKAKIQQLRPQMAFTVPRYPHLRGPTPAKPKPCPPAVNLKIAPNADLVWDAGFQRAFQLLTIDESAGISEQISPGRTKEIVMGLDFGTSSVKVVLGDRGAGKAYAVPFVEATGVNSYLLPSRVFETDGVFSLSQGLTAHRDLKLRFLTNILDRYWRETLVGFFGLVIRRCRAWLFREHADTFIGRNLLWKLVLGKAVDRAMDDDVSYVMERIAVAAWSVAGGQGSIDRKACAKALLLVQDKTVLGSESFELSVVPELAAQIHGFVMSRQFDPKAKNIYLIVDVGAGTVDVSLFRVKPTAIGTWDYSLFTSVVEPNGVMNLHRTRLEWWCQQLIKLNDDSSDALIQKLQSIRSPTEQTLPIPERFDGYINGLKAEFSGSAVSPDDDFYMRRLVHQVRGQGLDRKFVGKVDVAKLPFFLCGGGSRLPLYRNLSQTLYQAPGWEWLQAYRRDLGIPGDLVAPGLPQADYDRLSVAYGLSLVDVGNLAVAPAMPVLNQKTKVDWQSRYLDKDQC